jgi:hypothetical protein
MKSDFLTEIRDGFLQIHSIKFKKFATFLLNFRSEYLKVNLIYLIMKKLILFALIFFIAVSCKKVTKEPYGPTDIRIRNITTVTMTNVRVNTYDSTFNFGTINANSVSEYHRFDRAYPVANISAYINGVRYKTDTVASYAYMQYMGVMKATYEIWKESDIPPKLVIKNLIPDSGLK